VIPPGDAGERADPKAVGERRKAVLCARTNRKHAKPVTRHERHASRERRCGGDVRHLARRDLGLARLAATFAESRKVERQRRVAAFGDSPRVGRGHLLLHRQPRAHDDDARLTFVESTLPKEPACKRHSLAVKDHGIF
jgi:hypothetical protein